LNKLNVAALTSREIFEKLRVNKAEVPHIALDITIVKRRVECISIGNFATELEKVSGPLSAETTLLAMRIP